VPQQLQLIALDGYPLAQTRMQDIILVPPAGRAEFIVQAPPQGASAQFMTLNYPTGPTGNPDLQTVLATVELTTGTNDVKSQPLKSSPAPQKTAVDRTAIDRSLDHLKFSGLSSEKPVITTNVGAVEDWTIENHALETHAFHIHQIHFLMLEVDGQPVANQDLRDTIEIPFWTGKGPYPSVKVRMDFRDPTIAGTFVFHCHVLLHEDLGMMHKIQVLP
jgi:FtsP/CotA-like multicopper oxidase with cupredoxin domain